MCVCCPFAAPDFVGISGCRNFVSSYFVQPDLAIGLNDSHQGYSAPILEVAFLSLLKEPRRLFDSFRRLAHRNKYLADVNSRIAPVTSQELQFSSQVACGRLKAMR